MTDIKRNIIKKYMGDREKLNIDEILDLLEENENLEDIIFREREYEYHREDVRAEIQYLNEERKENNEELYEISDETIEEITDKYEDVLGDSEEWHFILKEVLRDFGVK